MYFTKTRKLTRITLGFTPFLIISSLIIPLCYAIQWSPDTRLTWHESLDWAPSITQAKDGRIWIVWHSYEIGTNPDVLYKVYNGSSTFQWSSIRKLTTDPGVDMTPTITTAGENIWVVWSSNRTGNFEIHYKIYNGSSWTPDTRLTENASVDEFPSIMQDRDGDIWVVWSSDRTGNFEIHYQVYNGSSWQPCGQLTSDRALDWDPSIMQAQDGRIWIVWVRGEDLFYKVFFKNMTDIVLDTPLTEEDLNVDWHPSIMQAQDGRIWITWDSCALEYVDIYCKIYNGSWSQKRITYNSLDDLMPSIMQATDGTIWIAWASDRLGNFDIYYKTDSPPQHLHDIAVISVTHNPNVTVAYQGSNVYIEVVPQNQGVESEYFQVNCYANSTLIGSVPSVHLIAGQLMPLDFTWNTLNVTPGTYTIIANASITGETDTDTIDNTFINGRVHVRIPGDANGDGVVDASDLFDLSKAYGSDQSKPNWNPDCDFNRNNKVDAPDLFDLNKNYGKTI